MKRIIPHFALALAAAYTSIFASNPNPLPLLPLSAAQVSLPSSTISPAETLSIQQPYKNSGRRTLMDKTTDSISVKDFLCKDGQLVKGDGSHDDTTGIQAAIDALGNSYEVAPA